MEKSLVEKMAVEKKPGGKKAWSILEKMEKKPGGKKAWSILEKMEKKPGVFF